MNCTVSNASSNAELFTDAHYLGHLFPGLGFILIALLIWGIPALGPACCVRSRGNEKSVMLQFAFIATPFISFIGFAVALATSQGTNWNHASMLLSFCVPFLAIYMVEISAKHYRLGLVFAFAATYMILDVHGIIHTNTVQRFMHAILLYIMLATIAGFVIQLLFLEEKPRSNFTFLVWNINLALVLSTGIWFILLGVFVHTESGYVHYIESCVYHNAGGHAGALVSFSTLLMITLASLARKRSEKWADVFVTWMEPETLGKQRTT